jgi:hypothetical protein
MLTIVAKQAMQQEVVPSAELFQAGLKTTGHVEVPGVFFDTGKSELKPESDAAVAEVAKLLEADPALKVYVVGHTDNVASLDLNTKLSQTRADAVVQALVAKHGIAAGRNPSSRSVNARLVPATEGASLRSTPASTAFLVELRPGKPASREPYRFPH